MNQGTDKNKHNKQDNEPQSASEPIRADVAPPLDEPKQQSPNNQCNCKYHSEPDNWSGKWPTKIRVAFELALAALGAFLLYQQNIIMDRQTTIMNYQLSADRANLTIHPGKIDRGNAKNISIILENVGKITAEKIYGTIKVTMREIDAEQSRKIGAGDNIAPGSSHVINHAIGNLNISFLTIYGRIYYTDGFTVRRFTDFCYNVNFGMTNAWQTCGPQQDKDIQEDKY